LPRVAASGQINLFLKKGERKRKKRREEKRKERREKERKKGNGSVGIAWLAAHTSRSELDRDW
jgi:hypothetical protein